VVRKKKKEEEKTEQKNGNSLQALQDEALGTSLAIRRQKEKEG